MEPSWTSKSAPHGSLAPSVSCADSALLGLASASGLLRCGLTLATGLCLDPRLSFCWRELGLSVLAGPWVPVPALHSSLGTEELYKKDFHDPDNHDGVITHLEPDILECEVKWALESITKVPDTRLGEVSSALQ